LEIDIVVGCLLVGTLDTFVMANNPFSEIGVVIAGKVYCLGDIRSILDDPDLLVRSKKIEGFVEAEPHCCC